MTKQEAHLNGREAAADIMKRSSLGFQHSVLLVLLLSSPSFAQSEEPVPHRWSHGTTLALSGGAGTASDDAGALLGGSIGWEIAPRVGVEGTATWLGRQPGASAFAASLSVHATLTKARPVSPFVEGGFGLYLASFDPNRATTIPPFYRDRMSGVITNWFTDPAFFGGAGVDVFSSNHIAIRPTIGALVAVNASDTYTVGMLFVRVDYHFEDHLPPSSSRRR